MVQTKDFLVLLLSQDESVKEEVKQIVEAEDAQIFRGATAAEATFFLMDVKVNLILLHESISEEEVEEFCEDVVIDETDKLIPIALIDTTTENKEANVIATLTSSELANSLPKLIKEIKQ